MSKERAARIQALKTAIREEKPQSAGDIALDLLADFLHQLTRIADALEKQSRQP